MALLEGGGYSTHVAVDERQCLRVPEKMDLREAGAIPETWLTAYQLLKFCAGAKSTDRVMIHAGASGVGTAAIQLAKHVFQMPEIYITAGSQEKIDFCKALGATEGFNHKDGSWARAFKERLGEDAAVDVILDCIGYPYFAQDIKVAAMDARLILFGLMGGKPNDEEHTKFLRFILSKRISLIGTTLRSRSHEYKGELVRQFQEDTSALFSQGILKPILDAKSFQGLESIPEGQEYMKSNASIGKITVSI